MKEIVVTVKPHHVNSKSFGKEFIKCVYELMIEFNSHYGEVVPSLRHRDDAGVRSSLLEDVEIIMSELEQAGEIKSNWEVVSDHRNNSEADIGSKTCHMLITLTQPGCLNVTSFDFIIQG